MSVTSTLDKIKDTTIMRMIRKMAGVIDEQTEAVEALNTKLDNINIEGLDVEVAKNTGDIKQLKISDAEHTEQIATIDSNVDNHAREITALKTADAKHDTEIAELDKVTDALTKEIPNGITLYRDGTGKIKAVISQEDDTTIDSNTLDMIIPYQYTIISGTSSRSFKLKIVMSDGSEVITNDFIIPEGGGSVVTITGIEIDKDATDVNKFLVKAIVNEGDPITSNAITMVDSVSGTFANNKLTIKVNGISSTPITIDTTGTAYTAGSGIKIASGVISIDDTKVALKSDISDMETKTNANATFATKTELATKADTTTVTQIQTAVGDCFNEVALGSDGKSLDFTAVDGQVNNVVLPTVGDGWEYVDLDNFPTDWVANTEMEIYMQVPRATSDISGTSKTWNSEISSTSINWTDYQLIRVIISNSSTSTSTNQSILITNDSLQACRYTSISSVSSATSVNTGTLMTLECGVWNGVSSSSDFIIFTIKAYKDKIKFIRRKKLPL